MSAKDLFLERSLPSSVDAERSVLGSILLDNRLCNQAMEVLRPDDFYLDAHRKVYEKMISLSEQGRPIDPITLGEELRRVGEFEQVGGGSYVAGLIDTIPRLENIEQYTKIVKDKATLRRLIATSNQIIASCFEQEQDTAQIIDHAEKSIFAIAEDRMREGFTDVGTIAHKRLEEIEAMAGRAEMITGVPTGFTDLDKMTAGLQRSDLVVVAARPSMGKCLAYDSEIVLADGSVATIEEVYRAGRARLLTLTNDWRLAWAEPSAFVDDGRKPVFRVTTRLGRSVETTITHPFLTVDGWRRLAQLKPGEKIAVVRRIPVFGEAELDDSAVEDLAERLARSDALAMTAQPAKQAAARIRSSAARFAGSNVTHGVPQAYAWGYTLAPASQAGNLCGARLGDEALERSIPSVAFTLCRRQVALLLNRIFALGGWVSEVGERRCEIRFATASGRLARQVQHLLTRFGIVAGLGRNSAVEDPPWVLRVSDPISIRAFSEQIGLLREAELSTGSDVYWDEIVSIEPCGLKQVYDLTIPETHNFVANDVCVHNTSLALNVAQYAARAGYTVGVFSLEMSAQQLVSRLLCSEAHIDAHRFRTGYLNREEWARLADGLHRLSESRIFIDDSPGITVLEMRAKARRLKQEHGLDMLLVDYLQLIQGRGRVDSRTNEVSQISRDLKMLAKELNVPLIALSQLSRAPETRTDHRPQLSDLRESGCLAGDTLVTLADTGARVPIRDLVGRSGFRVWALDEATMRTVPAVVSRAFATGTKPVFRLETKLGRVIRATGNHKFRTLDGWRRLDELEVGERLAVPRRVPCGDAGTISFAEAALLGHLIGDGCTLPRHVIQYTTREPELAEVVVELATNVFGKLIEPHVKRERTWYQVYLPAAFHLTHGKRSPVAEWLGGLGVFGLRSYEKRVPQRMFEQSGEVIGRFLRHLWATDGCVKAPQGSTRHPAIYYSTSSERLARDVSALLLRLGINAVVRPVSQGSKGRTQFTVRVMGREDIIAFAERVGAVGSRRTEALEACFEWVARRDGKTNRDVIPSRVWEHFALPAAKRRGWSLPRLQRELGIVGSGTRLIQQNVSRGRLARIGDAVGGDRGLDALATSDVYWDVIVSITPVGEADVYDLTVPGPANFIADELISHNSIEQDADVVAFIYREEMYGATDENQGVAELIIGKQRNGPTGVVRLAFLKEFTRFENLWNEGY